MISVPQEQARKTWLSTEIIEPKGSRRILEGYCDLNDLGALQTLLFIGP